MDTDSGHASARIYQFPTRTALRTANDRSGGRAGAERVAQRIVTTEFGSAWYHEAAIQDAARTRKD